MKKIGLMGGTFNPIHNGHLILAQEALEQAELDEIWLIPSGISYMKEGQDIPDGTIRFKMAELAAKGQPSFHASDIEISRSGKTYTADTLMELHELYPKDQFFFIVGGDTLSMMKLWYKPHLIFQSCTVLVGQRDTDDQEKLRNVSTSLMEEYGGTIVLLDFPNIQISSSEIRQKVSEGRSIHYLVPDLVEEYIWENRLYQ